MERDLCRSPSYAQRFLNLKCGFDSRRGQTQYPKANCGDRKVPVSADHIVIMGVSGSGKSTVGKLLAEKIGGAFTDGDDLHSEGNVARMAAGQPLDDADREPWLKKIAEEFTRARQKSLVVACSALKKSYRDIIRQADPTVRFVFLEGPRELLVARLAARSSGHFMPASLLQSQLDILEPLERDESGFALNIAHTPEELAREAARLLASA